jgi:hypothetical protein
MILQTFCIVVKNKIKLVWFLGADRANGKHKVKLKVI